MAIQHVHLDEVVGYFDELEDPRSTVNLKHPLVSVVVIALMAVLAGAGGPTAIAKWAAIKEEFLLKVLNLPHGIPRKDVFRRVLALLQPSAFQVCFANWLQSLRAKAAEATGVEQPVLAVDGKTARRSHVCYARNVGIFSVENYFRKSALTAPPTNAYYGDSWPTSDFGSIPPGGDDTTQGRRQFYPSHAHGTSEEVLGVKECSPLPWRRQLDVDSCRCRLDCDL